MPNFRHILIFFSTRILFIYLCKRTKPSTFLVSHLFNLHSHALQPPTYGKLSLSLIVGIKALFLSLIVAYESSLSLSLSLSYIYWFGDLGLGIHYNKM